MLATVDRLLVVALIAGSYTLGAVTFADQTVSTQAPPSSGCVVPPAVSSFLTTDKTVYLYFAATITTSDSLTSDWLAPNGTVIAGTSWDIASGYYCFNDSLAISNLPASELGSWQARVYDNGVLLFSVPFSVSGPLSFANQRVTTQAPNATSCIVPPTVTSFLTTEGAVYLYFEATVTTSDSLSNNWLAPDGTVIAGSTWSPTSGDHCFDNAPSLVISNLPVSQLGSWQARVYDNGALLLSVPFSVSAPAVSAPTISPGGVVNGASFTPGPVAPGSIVSIFGTALASGTAQATTTSLPTTLQSAQVLMNGIAAPLFYVSPTQINAQVPWEVTGLFATDLTVQVIANGSQSNVVANALAATAPGIFVVVHNADNTLVTSANPAVPREYLVVYCTGLGTVTNQPSTGAPAPLSPLSYTPQNSIVTIAGVSANVPFSGLAPDFVGLNQVDVQVPANVVSASAAPLVLSNGGKSTTATIAVQSGGVQQFTLTATTTGNGSGSISANPPGPSYSAGTVVTLTATPNAGSTFAGWSGACSGTGSCTVTMNSNQAVTATFNLIVNETLTTTTSGTGSGSVSSSPAGTSCGSGCVSFAPGTVVTLTATPNTGSTFAGWSGACSGAGSCTVTMNSNQAVTATFDLTAVSSSSQFISAAQGGSITLSDGTSVTVPPGALAYDQTVTLQLVDALPQQPPSGFLQNVGPGLVLTLSRPNPAASLRSPVPGLQPLATQATPPIEFTINTSQSTASGLQGAGGISYLADAQGNITAMGAGISNSGSGNLVISVPASYLDDVPTIAVGAANTVPSAALAPPSGAVRLGSDGWGPANATCPTGKVLVLVHGIFSTVEQAFPGAPSTPNNAQAIETKGGYNDVEGFDYDWTQSVAHNGPPLTDYLDWLASCPSVDSIDVEAHSYGGLVAGNAICKATLAQSKIKNFVTLGTPWAGTPAANALGNHGTAISVAESFSPAVTLLANFPISRGTAAGWASVASDDDAPVSTDLGFNSPACQATQQCIKALPLTIKKYTACGNVEFAGVPKLFESTIGMNPPAPGQIGTDDGIVPVSSCQAMPGATPLVGPSSDGNFSVSHIGLETDGDVQAAVATVVNPPSASSPTAPPSPGTYSGSCAAQTSPVTCCDPVSGVCSTAPGASSQGPWGFTLMPGTSLSQFTSQVCASVDAALGAAGCASFSCNYTAATSASATFAISCAPPPVPSCTGGTLTETCSATQQ